MAERLAEPVTVEEHRVLEGGAQHRNAADGPEYGPAAGADDPALSDQILSSCARVLGTDLPMAEGLNMLEACEMTSAKEALEPGRR